ncbi:MAG: hypothetical protein PHU65_06685, partial [Actinomycetota bacterium]|nr:hypothetical protein [Actinomycetota bacterium]
MKILEKIKVNKRKSSKILLLFMSAIILMLLATSCTKALFLPGVSLGYFIWEDENGKINISWSSDRKKVNFTGFLSTDGVFDDIEKSAFEEGDEIIISENTLSFDCLLNEEDFTDSISFACRDCSYIELNLKIDGNNDLNRINIGRFLNSPKEENFRITPDYFKDLKTIPWFKKHPSVEFFKKLDSNRYLTFLYILLLGVVLIEILRITKFRAVKRKGRSLFIS